VATGAALWHVCPADLSPGGEVPIVYFAAGKNEGRIMTISGQGAISSSVVKSFSADCFTFYRD
jgi:hypothetical protein